MITTQRVEKRITSLSLKKQILDNESSTNVTQISSTFHESPLWLHHLSGFVMGITWGLLRVLELLCLLCISAVGSRAMRLFACWDSWIFFRCYGETSLSSLPPLSLCVFLLLCPCVVSLGRLRDHVQMLSVSKEAPSHVPSRGKKA